MRANAIRGEDRFERFLGGRILKRLQEFARVEGMPCERVKSRLRRAKQRLKENEQLKQSHLN
jgi:hypothetical protein